MSSLLNPVGPEPASVYWRRRIVVILGILVVLFLLWWLISPGGSATPTAATASPSPLPTFTTAAPTASASPSTSAISGAPCQDEDITVTVTSDQLSFPVGTPAPFIMRITNTGAAPCSRDVGPAANTFTITSGGFDVWSSDACSPSTDSQVEEIPAGEAYAVKGTWDGTVTANGCGASATSAAAGAYQVDASNGDVTSEPLTFSLE